MRKNILNFTSDSLAGNLKNHIDFNYRTTQIFQSLHQKLLFDFNKITGLPGSVKKYLSENFEFPYFKHITTSESKDNTRKFLFEIINSNADIDKYERLETVLIQEENRITICISTQVGCNVGCEFCATGKMGFLKNLEISQIILQVYNVMLLTGKKPTNIVFMGMGEPFLNYENTIGALKILTDKRGLGIPSRKITVSTVGFNQKIRKFADDLVTENNKSIKNIKLALSLHSTNQGIRESIIPISKMNRLSDLYKELVYFYRTTGTKITYEYIFFPGINDTEEDIKRIVKLSGMIPCNFNLIPFHRIRYELKPPLDIFNNSEGTHNSLLINSLNYFISKLKSKKVIINLRSSSGLDINAACGQLATNFKK